MFYVQDRKGSHTPRGTDGNPGGALHQQNHAGLGAVPCSLSWQVQKAAVVDSIFISVSSLSVVTVFSIDQEGKQSTESGILGITVQEPEIKCVSNL